MARAVTVALCRELADLEHVGLNVHSGNLAAISCYESLGFTSCCRYIEGIIERNGAGKGAER
jgi:ribosomal protein S18 acetylase RimI-like enzyme